MTFASVMGDLPIRPSISNRVYYEIASSCNLNCIHCSALTSIQSKHLDFEQVLVFHEGIAKQGMTDSVVTGGEPTLHRDFEKIVTGLAKYGSVTVTTNGTVLSPEKMGSILARHPNVLLQVSMDGASEQVFDHIRGRGNYKKIVTLLEYLTGNDLGNQVGLSMTLMQYNVQEVPDLVTFAKARGIAVLHFPSLLTIGFALKDWKGIALAEDQQIEIEEYLLNLMEKETLRVSVNRICQIVTRLIHGIQGDCLANFTLKVNPDGEVLPCPATSNHDLTLGNIAEATIADNLPSRLEQRWSTYLDLAGSELAECRNCLAKTYCSSRFCENCGLLLSPPSSSIATYACKIFQHHYLQAISERDFND